MKSKLPWPTEPSRVPMMGPGSSYGPLSIQRRRVVGAEEIREEGRQVAPVQPARAERVLHSQAVDVDQVPAEGNLAATVLARGCDGHDAGCAVIDRDIRPPPTAFDGEAVAPAGAHPELCGSGSPRAGASLARVLLGRDPPHQGCDRGWRHAETPCNLLGRAALPAQLPDPFRQLLAFHCGILSPAAAETPVTRRRTVEWDRFSCHTALQPGPTSPIMIMNPAPPCTIIGWVVFPSIPACRTRPGSTTTGSAARTISLPTARWPKRYCG